MPSQYEECIDKKNKYFCNILTRYNVFIVKWFTVHILLILDHPSGHNNHIILTSTMYISVSHIILLPTTSWRQGSPSHNGAHETAWNCGLIFIASWPWVRSDPFLSTELSIWKQLVKRLVRFYGSFTYYMNFP